ncbi:MAG: AAA family ATPase [Sporichthyaceae bacterium]
MLPSPFNPGAGTSPPVLAGREDLLADADELLTRASHFGRAAGPLIWTGVRGVGKTVTLVEARRRAEQRRFVSAHVTADRAGGLSRRLAEATAGALAAADVARRGSGWERLAERLSAFNVQVSFAGVVTVGAELARPADVGAATQDMLRALLADAAAQIANAGRAGLLISLDELQEAPVEDLRTLVYALQELTVAGSPVVTVAAGLPTLPERLMEAGSFAERFAFRRMEKLPPRAALEALVRPAEQLGVGWTEAAAEAVVKLSSGSPYLLQLYADAAWQVGRPKAGALLDDRAVAAGVVAAERSLWDGQYRGRWNRATPAERALLSAIAASMDETGVARVGDIGHRLGKTSPQFSRDRASLIDKGLIEPTGYAELSFTVPGFERFVLAITSEERGQPPRTPPPVDGRHDPELGD